MKANGTLALLTDFGTCDWYVASMKAAALVANPEVSLIDITHEITPGSISEGAFVLNRCFNDFPIGTTFVVVVDPGVGTERDALIVNTREYFFVGPNNGVLSPTLNTQEIEQTVRIESEKWMGAKRSSTFHGRDIFAPAAARVAAGASISEAGSKLEELESFDFPQPSNAEGNLQGTILYFDRFGNGLTNFQPGHFGNQKLAGLRAGDTLFPLAKTFGEVERDEPVSYLGSSGFMEIALRDGNAKSTLGLSTDSRVFPVFDK